MSAAELGPVDRTTVGSSLGVGLARMSGTRLARELGAKLARVLEMRLTTQPAAMLIAILTTSTASGCDGSPGAERPASDVPERAIVVDMPLDARAGAAAPIELEASDSDAATADRSDSESADFEAASAFDLQPSALPVGRVVSVRPMPCGAVTLHAGFDAPACDGDSIWSGSDGADDSIGAIAFAAPPLPAGAQLLHADITLTGRNSTQADRVGRWYLRVVRLDGGIEPAGLTFGRLAAAPADIPGLAWRMRSDEITAGASRRFQVAPELLPVLETLLRESGGRLFLRLEGPSAGPNRFAWHARGDDAPRFRIAWAVDEGDVEPESLVDWHAP